jgi:hypothetical protein
VQVKAPLLSVFAMQSLLLLLLMLTELRHLLLAAVLHLLLLLSLHSGVLALSRVHCQ